jgi:adenosine kinase
VFLNLNKNKVIVLGSLAFDYLMTFEENFVNAVSIDHKKGEYQSTVTTKDRIQRFGGTAGNIAYNLGLLNIAQAHIFGAVGKDFESLGYQNHITKFKNLELALEIHPELFTAACYIVNDIRANQMIIFHGGALDHSKNIDLRTKISNPEDFVYAINSTQSVEAMINFAEQLAELKIPMIFDPGQITPLFPKENLLNVIRKTEILIGNSHEIKQILSKVELTEDQIITIVKALIITKGQEGSELIYKDESGNKYKILIPIAKPDKIADTTGAGDGYRAGILTGLILDLTLLDSCRLGAVISSFVVETHGPQTQSFKIHDVRKRFYETYGYIPSQLESL